MPFVTGKTSRLLVMRSSIFSDPPSFPHILLFTILVAVACSPTPASAPPVPPCDARGYCLANCSSSDSSLELDAIVPSPSRHIHRKYQPLVRCIVTPTQVLLDAHPSLVQSVGRAVDIMKRSAGVLSNDRFIVHLTLMYICCASRAIAQNILLPAFRSVTWQPLNISYSKAICNADGSIILLADDITQASLSALVQQFENAAAARGFVMQARATMEAFHTTIGTVNSSFPLQHALADINTEIPVWTPHAVRFDRFWLLSRQELQFWPPEEVVANAVSAQ